MGNINVDIMGECFNNMFLELSSLAETTNKGGKETERLVEELLKKYFPMALFITNKEWHDNPIYSRYRKRALSGNFNFSDLPDIDGIKIDCIIITNPNSSQKWPDFLIIFNKVGFPVEVKSGRSDFATWNGGLPKYKSLYIFDYYTRHKITYFLGEHIIDDEEKNDVLARALKARENNGGRGRWSFYMRAMYNNQEPYFEDNLILIKNEKLNKTIEENNKTIKNGEHSEKRNATLSRKNDELVEKILSNTHTYNEDMGVRLLREKETSLFVSNLPWDDSQKTDFSNDMKNDEEPEDKEE